MSEQEESLFEIKRAWKKLPKEELAKKITEHLKRFYPVSVPKPVQVSNVEFFGSNIEIQNF